MGNKSIYVHNLIGCYVDSESVVPKIEGRRVVVPRPDDETFTTFFESVTRTQLHSEHLEVTEEDLDCVTRQSGDLLVTKKTVRVQRKHAGTARNPIKALAARSDIKEEYTEIITGVADREKRRMKVEKCKGKCFSILHASKLLFIRNMLYNRSV